MKIIKSVILVSIIFCISNYDAEAQLDTIVSKKYRIETLDGNEFVGIIKEETTEHIILITDNLGEIKINTKDIKSKKALGRATKVGGQYWLDNPQSTRYFWQPNGYGLEQGEGYYQNVWVLFNSFAVAVTDNVSFGAGIVPLFLLGGTATPVWITPKLSIPVSKDKVNLGVGVLAGTVLGEEESGFGILYGISTFGSRDYNVSFGLGYAYSNEGIADYPIITVSTMLRTGPKGYFISENYFISVGNETFVLLSLGGRRIIKRAGLDYGLFIPISKDIDNAVAIPWLGISLPFGK